MNWGWWRVRRIALPARAHTARRLARLADDVGLRFWLHAMRDWVARVVLGVLCPGFPFAFLIEANPLGEAARLLVTLHKVNVTSQHPTKIAGALRDRIGVFSSVHGGSQNSVLGDAHTGGSGQQAQPQPRAAS